MDNENDIKALTPVICPHCGETLVVEFSIAANLIDPVEAAEILKDIDNAELDKNDITQKATTE